MENIIQNISSILQDIANEKYTISTIDWMKFELLTAYACNPTLQHLTTIITEPNHSYKSLCFDELKVANNKMIIVDDNTIDDIDPLSLKLKHSTTKLLSLIVTNPSAVIDAIMFSNASDELQAYEGINWEDELDSTKGEIGNILYNSIDHMTSSLHDIYKLNRNKKVRYHLYVLDKLQKYVDDQYDKGDNEYSFLFDIKDVLPEALVSIHFHAELGLMANFYNSDLQFVLHKSQEELIYIWTSRKS